MKNRRTDTVTRVDVRIPNELYSQIQEIATFHFNAKIHHRSGKPEISPTIIELIKIGSAHIESERTYQAGEASSPVLSSSILPATEEKAALELREQIKDLDRRLQWVESKLSGVSLTAPVEELDITESEKGLSDLELAEVLGVSNILIRDYRVYGKKPGGQVLAKALTEQWEVRGERWVKQD